MRNIKNINLILMLVALLWCREAGAISKLDFTKPVQDIKVQIGKVNEKIEQKTGNVQKKLKQKTMQGTGAEGKKIFMGMKSTFVNQLARGDLTAGSLVDSAIDSSSFKMLNDFRNGQVKVANIQSDMNLLEKQLAEDNNAKADLIDQQISSLTEQKKKVQAGSKEETDINNKIADLEAQKVKLKNVLPTNNPQYLKKKQALREAQNDMTKLRENLTTSSFKTKLDNASNSLIKKLKKKKTEGENEDNAKTYSTVISDFFLAEKQTENAESTKQIAENRNKEYYSAAQNLMQITSSSLNEGAEINETANKCLENANNTAESIDGEASMRDCVTLENAKASARYMELLLAKMRYQTTQEMSGWNNRYKMKDYSKDVTKFNLDAYKSTGKSKTKDKVKDWVSKNASSIIKQ